MKWLLLAGVVAVGVAVVGLVLKDVLPDPNVLPGWDTEERRRMMLLAEASQDEDLKFI